MSENFLERLRKAPTYWRTLHWYVVLVDYLILNRSVDYLNKMQRFGNPNIDPNDPLTTNPQTLEWMIKRHNLGRLDKLLYFIGGAVIGILVAC